MRPGPRTMVVVLFLFMIIPGPSARAAILDRIVASVNGEIITLSEVDARVKPLADAQGLTDPAQIEELRRQVIDSMVDRLLVFQACKRLEITITDEEVDALIEELIKSKGGTMEAFKADLVRRGMPLDLFRKDVAADLARRKIIQREIQARIVVPEEEINAYLKQHGGPPPMPTGPAQQQPPARQPQAPRAAPPQRTGPPPDPNGVVRLRNIVILLPENPTDKDKEEVKKILEGLYKGIAEGRTDFAAAAKKYSKAPNADNGGDLGELAWKDMDPTLREVLITLPQGGISPPLVAGNSVQVFQVVSYTPAAGGSAAQAAPAPPPQPAQASPPPQPQPAPSAPAPDEGLDDREKVRRYLFYQKMEKKFEEWVTNLRKGAMVRIDY